MNLEEKSSILIVDDNSHNIQILAEILRNKNYKVAMVKDGEKALHFLKKRIAPIMTPTIRIFNL